MVRVRLVQGTLIPQVLDAFHKFPIATQRLCVELGEKHTAAPCVLQINKLSLESMALQVLE